MTINKHVNNKFKKLVLCSIMFIFTMVSVFGVVGYDRASAAGEENQTTDDETRAADFSDLVGRKIAICEGTIFEDVLKKNIPGGDVEIQQYKTTTDAVQAVVSKRTDAATMDYPVAMLAVGTHDELTLYPQKMEAYENGWAFRKGDERRDEFSAVLEQFTNDGTLDELMKKWTTGDPSSIELPEQDWPGSKGNIVFASSPDYEPIYYMDDNGELRGYDVELMLLVCKELDYHVKFLGVNFDAMMPSLASGKADVLGGGLAITAEREETMDYTVPEYTGAATLVVRKDSDLAPADSSGSELEYNSLKELEDKEFACSKGMIMEQVIPTIIKGAIPEVYNSSTDCLAALKTGKVDVFYCSEPDAYYFINQNTGLGMIDEKVFEDNLGFPVAKGSPLKSVLDPVIKKYSEDGTLDELKQTWVVGNDVSKQVIDKSGLTGENGTIRVFVDANMVPMVYYDDSHELVGYEIDLLYRIARETGYDLEFGVADFDGLLAALQGGKCDMCAGSISITEERMQVVDFTEPDYLGGARAVVRTVGGADQDNAQGFFASVADSFNRAFVVEGRWKLILGGLLVTVIISIASAIVGLLFGFLLCMMRRSKNKILSGIVAVFVRIIQGMPIVVMLMILYYIIFGSSDISGVIIAIVGFSINFAAYSSEMMRSGINAVDEGQREAALALGFTPMQSFFGVVFPQAATHFIPVLKGEFISMVKMTSVVGYIAVEDLTKISDIIRARTMDAFFPLISTALIYFILANLLILVISFFEKRIDIKRRPRRVRL